MAVVASTSSAEMAKTSGIVKNWTSVPKPSSPRDSLPDDTDTVLVLSSDDIKQARAAVESVTSETATVDCHPVVLNEDEGETERLLGDDASSSGLVTKKGPLDRRLRGEASESDPEAETETRSAVQGQPTMVDLEEEEEIELSLSGMVTEAEQRATITEVREVEPLSSPDSEDEESGAGLSTAVNPRPLDDETQTEERPRVKPVPRFDDETMPIPKPDLLDLGGALETVPLNAALVQNVLAQVDARAAAREAGQPVPPLHLSPVNPHIPTPPQHQHQQQHQHLQQHHAPPPSMNQRQIPTRRVGVEIFITVLAFLAVAVPALYYLYSSFAQP